MTTITSADQWRQLLPTPPSWWKRRSNDPLPGQAFQESIGALRAEALTHALGAAGEVADTVVQKVYEEFNKRVAEVTLDPSLQRPLLFRQFALDQLGDLPQIADRLIELCCADDMQTFKIPYLADSSMAKALQGVSVREVLSAIDERVQFLCNLYLAPEEGLQERMKGKFYTVLAESCKKEFAKRIKHLSTYDGKRAAQCEKGLQEDLKRSHAYLKERIEASPEKDRRERLEELRKHGTPAEIQAQEGELKQCIEELAQNRLELQRLETFQSSRTERDLYVEQSRLAYVAQYEHLLATFEGRGVAVEPSLARRAATSVHKRSYSLAVGAGVVGLYYLIYRVGLYFLI